MKENSNVATLHQIIVLISLLALFAISIYYIFVTTFWIFNLRFDFISEIWGSTVFESLIFADLAHFFAFLGLLLSVIYHRTLFFEPSHTLLYIIVLWVSSCAFVVIETIPDKWEQRLKMIHDFLVSNPLSQSSLKFVEQLECEKSISECWEKIDVFVDQKFCKFAGLFIPLFPLLVGFSFVYLI